MSECSTYVLRDPESRSIRYIGKTKQVLTERLGRHIRDAQEQLGDDWADRTHRANWIRKLLKLGRKPELVLIHTYKTVEEANEAERMLIKHFRGARADLTNATVGGDGGVIPRKPAVADNLVLEAYRAGETLAEIALRFKTCKKRISKVVKAAGLTRTTWSTKRKP